MAARLLAGVVMSLLDRCNEWVLIYPEVSFEDTDGNTITTAGDTPFQARASIQLSAASGTSARRSESSIEGFETEQTMSLRFPRGFRCAYGYLGAQSKIVWRNQTWSIVGDFGYHNSSTTTRRDTYTMRRS